MHQPAVAEERGHLVERAGAGVDGSRAVRVHSIASAANDWDSQFFIYTPDHVWKEGEKYQFKMWARADKAASISVQSHTTPGNYVFWSFLAGNYSIGTSWQEYTYEGTVSADQAGANGIQTIAFNSPQWAGHCILSEGPYQSLATLTPLHFIEYDPVIKIMDETDLDRLLASGKMFCRKVVSGRSDKLVDMLIDRNMEVPASQNPSCSS